MAAWLQAQGMVVRIVAINATTAENTAADLLAKCTFSVLQDVDTLKAWELMGGGKDDFYIYGSDGRLAIHLPHGGDVSTNLTTAEGWTNVLGLLHAVK